MRIWIVTIGEPVQIKEGETDRLHRTGFLAQLLSEKGHDIIWWTSTFDHFRKNHLFDQHTSVELNNSLKIRLLHGCGYKRNISFQRLKDHRQIAQRFAEEIRENGDRPDIILTSLPTIELSYESVRFGIEKDIPVVLDMRDMWPDIFIDLAPRPIQPLARRLLKTQIDQMRYACTNAAAIIGITNPFVEWGLGYAGRKRQWSDQDFPLGYISSMPAAEQIETALKFWDDLRIEKNGSSFTVCYIGSLNYTDKLTSIILAANELNKSMPGQFRFVICGVGNRLEHFKKLARGNSDIIFPGWIDRAKIYVLLRRAQIGIDPLWERFDFISTINNKAIEYMSAGLPVISSPKKGLLADLLAHERCGLSYESDNFNGLVDVLKEVYQNRKLLKELSDNAERVFLERMRAEKVYNDMANYLAEIVNIHNR